MDIKSQLKVYGLRLALLVLLLIFSLGAFSIDPPSGGIIVDLNGDGVNDTYFQNSKGNISFFPNELYPDVTGTVVGFAEFNYFGGYGAPLDAWIGVMISSVGVENMSAQLCSDFDTCDTPISGWVIERGKTVDNELKDLIFKDTTWDIGQKRLIRFQFDVPENVTNNTKFDILLFPSTHNLWFDVQTAQISNNYIKLDPEVIKGQFKTCSDFEQTANGEWFCRDEKKVFGCEDNPVFDGKDEQCKTPADKGELKDFHIFPNGDSIAKEAVLKNIFYNEWGERGGGYVGNDSKVYTFFTTRESLGNENFKIIVGGYPNIKEDETVKSVFEARTLGYKQIKVLDLGEGWGVMEYGNKNRSCAEIYLSVIDSSELNKDKPFLVDGVVKSYHNFASLGEKQLELLCVDDWLDGHNWTFNPTHTVNSSDNATFTDFSMDAKSTGNNGGASVSLYLGCYGGGSPNFYNFGVFYNLTQLELDPLRNDIAFTNFTFEFYINGQSSGENVKAFPIRSKVWWDEGVGELTQDNASYDWNNDTAPAKWDGCSYPTYCEGNLSSKDSISFPGGSGMWHGEDFDVTEINSNGLDYGWIFHHAQPVSDCGLTSFSWAIDSTEGANPHRIVGVYTGVYPPNEPVVYLNFTNDDANFTNESMWLNIYLSDNNTETNMSADIIIMNSTTDDITTAVQQYSLSRAISGLNEPQWAQFEIDQYNHTLGDYVWGQARLSDGRLYSDWVNSSSLKVLNKPVTCLGKGNATLLANVTVYEVDDNMSLTNYLHCLDDVENSSVTYSIYSQSGDATFSLTNNDNLSLTHTDDVVGAGLAVINASDGSNDTLVRVKVKFFDDIFFDSVNLIGHWTLNDTVNDNADGPYQGGDNPLAYALGVPLYSSSNCKSGACAFFDTSYFLHVGDSNIMQNENDWALTGYVNMTRSNNTAPGIFSVGTASSRSFEADYNPSGVALDGYVNDADLFNTNSSLDSGLWYYVVISYDKDEGIIDVYVDGVQTGRNSSIGAMANNLSLSLGTVYLGSLDQGTMDEVCYWNKSFNAVEVYDMNRSAGIPLNPFINIVPSLSNSILTPDPSYHSSVFNYSVDISESDADALNVWFSGWGANDTEDTPAINVSFGSVDSVECTNSSSTSWDGVTCSVNLTGSEFDVYSLATGNFTGRWLVYDGTEMVDVINSSIMTDSAPVWFFEGLNNTVNEDTPLQIDNDLGAGTTGNCTDIDLNETVSFFIDSSSGGTWNLSGVDLSYIPAANASGSYLGISVVDCTTLGGLSADNITIGIDVTADNDFPQWEAENVINQTALEDSGSSFIYNLDNVSWDVEDDANLVNMTYGIDVVFGDNNASGTNCSIEGANLYCLNEQENRSGDNILNLTALDADGAMASVFMNISTLPVNDAPDVVALNLPLNNTNFSLIPEFNWSNSTDLEGDFISYVLQIDESPEFTEPVDYYNGSIAETDNTTEDISVSLSEGGYFWRVLATDSQVNSSWSEVRYFSYDTTPPLVIIDSPTNISYSNETIDFNFTAIDNVFVLGDLTFWYSNDSGAINYSISANTSFVFELDYSYHLNLWVNDTNGNENVTSIDFLVDAVNPVLSIVNPRSGGSYDMNVPLEISIVDTNLDTVWYEVLVRQSGRSKLVNTTFISNTSIQNLDIDSYQLYVYANDSVNNVITTNVEFSLVGSSTGDGGGMALQKKEEDEIDNEKFLVYEKISIKPSTFYKTMPLIAWASLFAFLGFFSFDFKKGKWKFTLLSLFATLIFIIFFMIERWQALFEWIGLFLFPNTKYALYVGMGLFVSMFGLAHSIFFRKPKIKPGGV